jgi:hypothetical protein
MHEIGEDGMGRLTPLGQLLVMFLVLGLALTAAGYLFLYTHHGEDLVCAHLSGCIRGTR